MLRIYCKQVTSRIDYVFQLFFEELLGVSYAFTTEKKNINLNYSDDYLPNVPTCVPHGIMQEQNIQNQVIISEKWNGLPIFFRTSGDKYLPFDLFAVAFYHVSRYEEYLPYQSDTHNRFTAEKSILFQMECLEMPIVNLYALQLKGILQKAFPDLVFQPRKFEYRSTIDIDQAWKYRNKGFLRNTLGFFRDLKDRKWPLLSERLKVLSGRISDPFFTFDFQDTIHQQHSTIVNYFILLGDYDTFDKNIFHQNQHFQHLIHRLEENTNYTIGIHPSYASNTNHKKMRLEVKRLEQILQREITVSRQHYLMHQFPTTYQRLIELGITEDHTMGYSTHLGFRAGIAAPFYFFDLSKNASTQLRLFPFCAMDITPLHYRQQSPEQAIITLEKMVNGLKDCGGLMISLWHNESLSENERWQGWRIVYERLIGMTSQ